MAYTIELDTKHFEPVSLEFMQCSVSDTVTFVVSSYAVPAYVTPTLWYKDPNGVLHDQLLTPHGDLPAAVFTADVGTFTIPGRYIGAVEFVDDNDTDNIFFTFPVVFNVLKNPRIHKWSVVAPEKKVANGASYTISTGSMDPIGGTITAKISDGIYTITDGGSVSIPDSSTGPIVIGYDSSSTESEITVTNNYNRPYLIPAITFEAYSESTVGFIVPTGDTGHELRRRNIASQRVEGRATVGAGNTFVLGAFADRPDDTIRIIGIRTSPIEQETQIIAGIPSTGEYYTDPVRGTQFSLEMVTTDFVTEPRVVVHGVSTTTDQFNYDFIQCKSYMFVE